MNHSELTKMSEIDQSELLKLQETLDLVLEKLDRNYKETLSVKKIVKSVYNALLGLIRSKGKSRSAINDKG